MVQTRRQSRGAATETSAEDPAVGTPAAGQKRANGDGVRTQRSRARKRRRVEPAVPADEEAVEDSTTVVPEETAPVDQRDQAPKTEGEMRPPTPLAATDSTGVEPSPAQSARGFVEVSPDEVELATRDMAVVIEKPSFGRGQSREESEKASTGPSQRPNGVHPQENGTGKLEKKQSSHIRFGSEEPTEDAHLGDTAPNADSLEAPKGSEDDSDEAPEAESLATGQIEAKARSVEAARAAEQQGAAAREKRKRIDARLKTQAEASRRKRAKPDPRGRGSSQGSGHGASAMIVDEAPLPSKTTSALPELLPDELLAMVPAVRPPTPPPGPAEMTKESKRHRFFTADEKPPKDIRRGNVRVRILETSSHHLTPKGDKRSKSIKESWLAGRRGRGGAEGSYERRKVGRGF
ncbi:MAG: hypothetical protein M1832_000321 [Thelocarpon impressellum]|nr:MAG: hypothetical protein M1832_000321 [Thelocarpon impressellum]